MPKNNARGLPREECAQKWAKTKWAKTKRPREDYARKEVKLLGEYMVLLSGSVDDMSMEYEGASVGDLMSLYAGEEGACIYDDAWALLMYVENGSWREA